MRFTCYTATLKARMTPPRLPLSLGKRRLESYFAAESRNGTNAAVEIRFDRTRNAKGQVPDEAETDAQWLDSCLRRVLPQPRAVGKGVDEIALIFADYWWKDPDWTFGMMFDLGFDPSPDAAWAPRGRRGAALFIGAIWDKRAGPAAEGFDDPTYLSEVGFSAAHELGHVFNLWHTGPPVNDHAPSFLTSGQPRVFGQPAFRFDPKRTDPYLSHPEFLARCEESEFVQPGGSRFGNRGTHGPDETVNLNRVRSDARFALRISVPRAEFWRFEPIQLDIGLSLEDRRQARATVPNEIDPAFARFDLWITEPNGSRRTYRSPIHLCPARRRRLNVVLGTPFARDLPVFGQSGGYTFVQAGEHALQAVLRLDKRTVIASNIVRVNVLPAATSKEYRNLRAVLRPRESARLLFYGSTPNRAHFEPLEARLGSLARHPASSDVRYMLGRAQLKSAKALRSSDRAQARVFAKNARDHLDRASQSSSLGSLRQAKAAGLIGEASEIAGRAGRKRRS